MSKDDPADAGDKKNAAAIPLCRQAKRRLKFQNVSKSVAVSESVRYLETHKWYAKRQKMVQVWNHYLPEGNWGKGLGISSFCAKLSSNFVLHDMSYFWCLGLSGPLELVLQVLARSCNKDLFVGAHWKGDGPSSQVPFEQQATFHRRDKYPKQVLSPLFITWRFPSSRGSKDFCSPLLWVHCHAYEEVMKELNETLAAMPTCNASVKLCSLESGIKRIEVRGAKCTEALKEHLFIDDCLLNGMSSSSSKTGKGHRGEGANELAKQAGCCKAAYVPNLLDPRFKGILKKSSKCCPPSYYEEKMKEVLEQSKLEGEQKLLEEFESNPISDSALCRLHRKATLLHDIFGIVLGDKNEKSEECLSGESFTFPVMIVSKKVHNSPNDVNALSGFSMLVPKSWVHTIWLPLILKGGMGAGLREWKWYTQWICGEGIYPESYEAEGVTVFHREMNQEPQSLARSKHASQKVWVRSKGADGGDQDRCRVLLHEVEGGRITEKSEIWKMDPCDLDVFLRPKSVKKREKRSFYPNQRRLQLGQVSSAALPKKVKGFTLLSEGFCYVWALKKAFGEQQNYRSSLKNRILVLIQKDSTLFPAWLSVP